MRMSRGIYVMELPQLRLHVRRPLFCLSHSFPLFPQSCFQGLDPGCLGFLLVLRCLHGLHMHMHIFNIEQDARTYVMSKE